MPSEILHLAVSTSSERYFMLYALFCDFYYVAVALLFRRPTWVSLLVARMERT